MKVLIADFDLYKKIGGGQTAYRKLIESNPDIDFYYLVENEKENIFRHQNAHPIQYQEVYSIKQFRFARLTDCLSPTWTYHQFVLASNIAASVSGQSFDCVELPDYHQFGIFLRPAFKHHGVNCQSLVLALHGCISTTIRLNWGSDGSRNVALNENENLQYLTADIRYGISRSYILEWLEKTGIEASYLNPLKFLKLVKPSLSTPSELAPSLTFVGRTERRKGADIFTELVWWLPRESYTQASIIGPDSILFDNSGSSKHLKSHKAERLPDLQILPELNEKELTCLFATKTIVFLPSRYDTLNLLSLESLFAGCPTAIGSGAGVCQFLQEYFPNVPFVTIDVENVYACLAEIRHILANYDSYRKKLVDALHNSRPQQSGLELKQIYRQDSHSDVVAVLQLDRWYQNVMEFYNRRMPFRLAAQQAVLQSLRSVKRSLYDLRSTIPRKYLAAPVQAWVRRQVSINMFAKDDAFLGLARYSSSLPYRYIDLHTASEFTEQEIEHKLNMLWSLNDMRIDRARIWGEIARLERLRGNEIVAATYDLRVMRLLNDDRLNRLATLSAGLRKQGYTAEAAVAEAMFGPIHERFPRSIELIEASLREHKQSYVSGYELVDDRRASSPVRVSVIVSLYNAADKLKFFLHALSNQSMLKNNQVEIILIDANSPSDDYAVFKQVISDLGLSAVYARTKVRETIQNAWNRGISFARAPYICFLGVDEGLLPEALETLAIELDSDPTLDWVMSSSLMTSVNSHGCWQYDVMKYDRSGYKQHLVSLETCYLSWVGGLYRKSIHERFGYYDATFGAAGDTEFKSRVLPYLKTKAIPKTLGIFWNYPDERVTESPRAELEDLRAWYIYRTLPGLTYTFKNRPLSEIEEVLYDCLSYRKSYCKHQSTDLEYALNAVCYLEQQNPASAALKYSPGIKQLLSSYRELDWLPNVTRIGVFATLASLRRLAERISAEHQSLSHSLLGPAYLIFNDNRYEQHSHLWKGLDRQKPRVK